jgi:hypothetical protein
MKPKTQNVSIAEAIIITQSVFLCLVGLAGWMASAPVNDGFAALRDRDSAVAIVTDKGITTDKTEVDLRNVEKVLKNYETVCLTIGAIGLIVLVGTVGRAYLKPHGKNQKRRR